MNIQDKLLDFFQSNHFEDESLKNTKGLQKHEMRRIKHNNTILEAPEEEEKEGDLILSSKPKFIHHVTSENSNQ